MRPTHLSRESIAHRRTASKTVSPVATSPSAASAFPLASSTQTRFTPLHPPTLSVDEHDEHSIRNFSFPSSPASLESHPDDCAQSQFPTPVGPSLNGSPRRPSNINSHSPPGNHDDTPPKAVSHRHRFSPSLPYQPYSSATSHPQTSSSWTPLSLLHILYSNLRRYPFGQLLYAITFTCSLVVFLLALSGVGYAPSSLMPIAMDFRHAQKMQQQPPVLSRYDFGLASPHDIPSNPKLRIRPITSSSPLDQLRIVDEHEADPRVNNPIQDAEKSPPLGSLSGDYRNLDHHSRIAASFRESLPLGNPEAEELKEIIQDAEIKAEIKDDEIKDDGEPIEEAEPVEQIENLYRGDFQEENIPLAEDAKPLEELPNLEDVDDEVVEVVEEKFPIQMAEIDDENLAGQGEEDKVVDMDELHRQEQF